GAGATPATIVSPAVKTRPVSMYGCTSGQSREGQYFLRLPLGSSYTSSFRSTPRKVPALVGTHTGQAMSTSEPSDADFLEPRRADDSDASRPARVKYAGCAATWPGCEASTRMNA